MPRDRGALPSLPGLPWHVALELAPEWGAPSLRLLVSRANRMVTALRSMSTGFIRDPGGGFPLERGCSWARARHQQRDLCRRLASFWKAWVPDLESAPASAEAVRLLLGTTLGGYGGGEVDPLLQGMVDSGGRPLLPKGAICEIDVEEISLPEPGTIMAPLVDICPDAAYYFKTMDDTMLIAPARLDRAALKTQKVYRDPALQDLQPRLRLCERLWVANMIGFTDRCEETLALFGVIKKYTDVEGASPTRSIRPVWDERRCNLRWEAPPFVPLGSPASFGHLDLSGLGPGDIAVSGTGDILDMFSKLSLPPQAWPWFVLDVDRGPSRLHAGEGPRLHRAPRSALRRRLGAGDGLVVGALSGVHGFDRRDPRRIRRASCGFSTRLRPPDSAAPVEHSAPRHGHAALGVHRRLRLHRNYSERLNLGQFSDPPLDGYTP